MRRRWLAPILMLFAGALAYGIMFFQHYETKDMLLVLIAVLVGFYVIGCLYTMMLNIFDRQNEELAEKERQEQKLLEEAEAEGQEYAENP